jgi:hypothetical protein
MPSGIGESNSYKLKVVSTSPAGTVFEDGVSNSFTYYGTLTKPTFSKMDTLSCGKDSLQLNINSSYSNFKIYDRKTLVASPGNNKKPKIKPGLGMHYLTVSASYQSCLVSSDTLKFLRDTFPVISISSPSHSNLNVCENDTVTLKVTGCSSFDLLGNSFKFIQSYTSTQAKRVIAKTGDSLMAKYKGTTGCIDTSNILKFTRNTNPTVTITSSDADLNVCMNDSIVLTGGGASTYQLFKNSSPFKSSFTSTIKPGTLANNDKFQLFGVDAKGCKDSSDVLKFVVDTVPNVSVSCSDTDLVLCINTAATFSFKGATNYDLYKNSAFWKTATSNPFTTAGINDNDVISVLGSSTKNCSSYSNTLKFKISNPKVTLKLNNTGLICSGDSIHFSFTGAKSYQIFKNNTLIKNTTASYFKSIDFANNDVVYVEGTDTFGCVAKSSSITLSIKTRPTVKLFNNDKDNSHCISDNVVLSFSTAATYNLYKNGSIWKANATSPLTTKDIKDKDVVYLIGIATNGCSATSDTLKFTVYPLPTVSISSPSGSSVCEKDSILLKFSGGIKYDFYLNNSFVKQITDSVLYVKDVVKDDEVYIYGYSKEGCRNRSNKLILSVLAPPTISITNPDTDNTTCKGENVNINFSGGVSYDLYRNNTFWKTTYGNPLSFGNAGDKEELYAIGYDGNKCKSISNTIKLTVLDLPSVSLTKPDSDNTTCDGEKITVNFTGGTKYDIYQNGSMLNFNITSPYTLFGMKNGDRIHVTGTNTNGCTDSSNSINLTVLSLPTITITNPDTDNAHCKGENVVINFSGGATYDLFKNNVLWKTNTGNSVTLNDAIDRDEIYSVGIGSNGCSDTSNKIKFTVWPIPNKPTITKSGTVLSSSYPTGNQWYEGTSKLTGATAQNYSPVKTATYFVEHTDANGCLSPLSDGFGYSVSISKIKLQGLKIYPNPASDYLVIETGESGKFHLSLIDITGKLVKEESFTGNRFEWLLKPAKGIYTLKIVNEKGESENVVVEFK